MIKVDSLEVMLDKFTGFELHREGGRYYVMQNSDKTKPLAVVDRLENPSPENDDIAKTRFKEYVEEYRRDYSLGFLETPTSDFPDLDVEAVYWTGDEAQRLIDCIRDDKDKNGPADNTGNFL